MIRSILAPTDRSASANGAVALAADLAGHYGARLILLHIGFRDGEAPRDLRDRATQAFDRAKAAGQPIAEHPEWSPHHQMLAFMGRMILSEARAHAERLGARDVEEVLDFGDDAERILHHARHRGVDLIVMGTRGQSELEGLLLGSVSNKVQHLAPCTTILVRQPEGSRLTAYHTMVVATDGSAPARKACQLAGDLARKADAKLVFLHVPLKGASPEQLAAVVDPGELSARAQDDLRLGGLPLPIVTDETLAEIGQLILAQAKAAAEASGVVAVETILAEGDPARATLDLARDRRADLILMGSRGVGMIEGLLLGSASNKVTHLATCPVVVVR
jgi:nucleotide-binding universal stress UspA family protein